MNAEPTPKMHHTILRKQLNIKVDIPDTKLNVMNKVFNEKYKINDQIYITILFIFNPLFLFVSNTCVFYNSSTSGRFPEIYILFNLYLSFIYTFIIMLVKYQILKINIKNKYLSNGIKIFTCAFMLFSFCAINAFVSEEASIFILIPLACVLWCYYYQLERNLLWQSYIENECYRQYQEMYDTPSLSETLLLK